MGRFIVGGLVMLTVLAGAAMYYLQVYAYYDRVSAEVLNVKLTSLITGEPEEILADNVKAIDADSSPIRYRACFDTANSVAMLTETYQIYDDAVPLNGPDWFDCFDAKAIGEALETGEAIAFLGEKNPRYGVDRIVAITQDGQGYVWHQINACGEAVFKGDDAPQGCPPAPEKGAQ